LFLSQSAVAHGPRTSAPNDEQLCDHPLADPGQAIPACTRLINRDPTGSQSAGWYNNRGIGWLKKGDIKHAIEDFTEALNRNPDFFDVFENRGIAYHMNEDYNSAIDDFNRALWIDKTGKRAAPV
jgi:tetratricopeptide (TPR) repeat protein